MGPLDVFLGWEAILLATLVYMATQLGKTIVDMAFAERAKAVASAPNAPLSLGRERRRQSRVLTRVVLPALPPLLGAALALVLPLPDSLAAWVGSQELWLALVARGAWGAACGQFADYLYSKLKALVLHERGRARVALRDDADEDGGGR